jgi:hypothetical protein
MMKLEPLGDHVPPKNGDGDPTVFGVDHVESARGGATVAVDRGVASITGIEKWP